MRRAIDAVESTRKLRAPSGHVDKDGKAMLVWAAISQPPEVRRKAKLLAKTKRAILEGYEKAMPKEAADRVEVKADYRKGMLMIG